MRRDRCRPPMRQHRVEHVGIVKFVKALEDIEAIAKPWPVGDLRDHVIPDVHPARQGVAVARSNKYGYQLVKITGDDYERETRQSKQHDGKEQPTIATGYKRQEHAQTGGTTLR